MHRLNVLHTEETIPKIKLVIGDKTDDTAHTENCK